MPGSGEGWDYPENLAEWGDYLMRSWHKAVFEIGGVGEYIEDLAILLELKVEKIEQTARVETATADVPDDDDVGKPQSPTNCDDGGIPDVGEAPNGHGNIAGQDAVQVAAS